MKIGDIVRLKSGGPKMTAAYIIDRAEGAEVDCHWILRGELQSARFADKELTPVKRQEGR
jgi:uncharacterized protein YodC (DUF2158 family)